MPKDERTSSFREALTAQRALVLTTRQLMIEFLALYGHQPSPEWLFKQIGLTP